MVGISVVIGFLHLDHGFAYNLSPPRPQTVQQVPSEPPFYGLGKASGRDPLKVAQA
jgi:hypothetical protein